MPDAEDNFNKSCSLLENLAGNLHRPDGLLTSPETLSDFVETVGHPDLIIYQCTTFIGGDFVTELTRRFSCPVIVWSLREPSIDGGRLKLNSLTGAFSAGNSLYMQECDYHFIFGNPDEPSVVQSFKKIFTALEMTEKLRELVIGVVGSQPPGFGFGNLDEALLAGKLGVRITKIEAASIIKTALSYSPESITDAIKELKERTKGWESLPVENLEKHARLRMAYQEFVTKNGVKTIASRCWPDFFTEYGVPVCSVLSFLNDNGIAASCETDIGGAISMFIGSGLTNSATYFGDPVAIDENCNGIVFWHCGAGATSLAREKEGAKLGVHPNRKIGPTMEFGLKSGKVTILRLGKSREGLRLMVMKGEALDEPQKFYGTSVTVRPESGSSSEKVSELVRDGWEPHFVIAYGDITDELRLICNFLKLRFLIY
ncbi:fucose isomerase [Bacteroidia bacterium]|nr:fucose isomerase [Bacteroidia bacterium]